MCFIAKNATVRQQIYTDAETEMQFPKMGEIDDGRKLH